MRVPEEELRQWIRQMYAHYCPSKHERLESILAKYSAKGPAGLPALFQALCVKYLDPDVVARRWFRLRRRLVLLFCVIVHHFF